MKIYFAGSIRGGRTDAPVYRAMIEYLSVFGEVLTEHVGDMALSEAGDDGPDDRYIHDRDMAWLSACDCLVAEVSVPSLGVGYELGYAVAMNKPVLCLCRAESRQPAFGHDHRQSRRSQRAVFLRRRGKEYPGGFPEAKALRPNSKCGILFWHDAIP